MSDNAPVIEVKEPTREEILTKWSLAELKEAIADPTKRAMIERIVNAPAVTPSDTDTAAAQLAAEAAAQAEAQAAEAQQAEALQVEAARLAEAAQRVEDERKAAEVVEPPKKIVVEYQATDEDGNPIGRPTHLEATTWEEMSKKQQTAHIEATRAFNRLKKQKTTFKQPEAEVKPRMTDEEMLAAAKNLNPDDPEKALEAVRKLTNQEEVEKREKAANDAIESARQERESFLFLKNHVTDFNQCQANADMLKNYLEENNLAWTKDNLEIAFMALQDQLAPVVQTAPVIPTPVPTPEPVVKEIVPVPVANPPVAAPTVPTTTPVVAAAPVVPVTPPAPAVNPPVPARRIPDSGIQPGQLQGARPAPGKVGLTKADIKKWTGKEMREQMRDPKRRAEIERVLSAK